MHPTWNKYPHLIAELDPDGNKAVTLRKKIVHVLEISPTTSQYLDWKCGVCNHRWSNKGNKRVFRNQGCPACANLAINNYDGRNSLAFTHPELANEYQGDATKIIAGTNKLLDWKCSICNNQWKSSGVNRTRKVKPRGCGFCNRGDLHSDGRNSLAQLYPELAKEYQGDATQVIGTTEKKLDWKCRTCDHEWKAGSRSRSVEGTGCPACSGNSLHNDGRNSMAMTHPDLAEEYQGDATKIMAGTDKKLLWKCSIVSDNPCGYEWYAVAYTRSGSGGVGCPRCAKTGFQPDKLGYYYVHKILNESGDLLMYKGGISGNWKKRLQKLRQKIPDSLTIELHEVIDFEIGQEARDLETTLLRMAAEEGWKAPPRDFDGGTELFLENPLDHARLKGLLSPKHK